MSSLDGIVSNRSFSAAVSDLQVSVAFEGPEYHHLAFPPRCLVGEWDRPIEYWLALGSCTNWFHPDLGDRVGRAQETRPPSRGTGVYGGRFCITSRKISVLLLLSKTLLMHTRGRSRFGISELLALLWWLQDIIVRVAFRAMCTELMYGASAAAIFLQTEFVVFETRLRCLWLSCRLS